MSLSACIVHATPPKPWEGADRPTPYTTVSTATGSATTAVPITGWKGRGLSVGLAIYHLDAPASGSAGWQHTYDIRLVPQTNSGWQLVESNGLPKSFTHSSGTYTEETGYFDTLTVTSTITGADCERTITRKSGIRLVFAHMGETPIEEGAGNRPTLVLRKIIDRNDNTIELTYGDTDHNGRLYQVQDPVGRVLTFTYWYTGTAWSTTVEDPAGQEWTLWPDSNGRWESITNTPATTSPATSPSSRLFTFTYNSNGSIASMRDWKTNATRQGQGQENDTTYSYTYTSGVLTRVDGPSWMVDAKRPATAYTYGTSPASALVKVKTDITGGNDVYTTVAHTYNSLGELATEAKWLGSEASSGDPTLTLGYTTNHLLETKSASAGGSIVLAYAANCAWGDVSDVYVNGAQTGTHIDYSDTANPHLATRVTDLNLNETTYKYSSQGNLTDVWDANHVPISDANPDQTLLHTHYKVDSHGLVFAASNAATQAYATNTQDSDADPMPKQWRYHYDTYGNQDKVWRPNGTPSGTWVSTTQWDQQRSYDSSTSRLVSSKRSSTDTQSNYHCDGYGRLRGIDDNNTGADEITYSYDENGNLSGMVDPTGTTAWVRDAIGSVTSETKDGASVVFSYRADGQPDTFTNRDSVQASYTYTAGGALDNVSGPWGTGNTVHFIHRNCTCNADGIDYPGFVYRDKPDDYGGSLGEAYYVRDSNPEHVYSDTDTRLFWENLNTLSNAGQTLSKIQSGGPGNALRVQYFNPTADPLGRLTNDALHHVTAFNGDTETLGSAISTKAYTFGDATSPANHTVVASGGSTAETATYDSLGRNQLYMVAYAGGDQDYYVHDANANLQEIYRWDGNISDHWFSYDARDKLTSICEEFGETYNQVGYLYDGLGRLAQKRSGATVTGRYYYAGDDLVYQTDVASSTAVSYQGAGGRLLSQRQTVGSTPTTYWYVLGNAGNVMALLDDANNVAEQYVYDAYGNEVAGTTAAEISPLPIPNPLRYRAAYGYLKIFQAASAAEIIEARPNLNVGTPRPQTVTEAGDEGPLFALYNVGARTYNTVTGRWMQEDPILGNTGDPMSFNRYAYCGADPANNSDPSGLTTILVRLGWWRDCYTFDATHGGLDIFDLWDLGAEGGKTLADALGKGGWIPALGQTPLGSMIKCLDRLFPDWWYETPAPVKNRFDPLNPKGSFMDAVGDWYRDQLAKYMPG